MVDSSDLAAALLAADVSERQALLRSASAADLEPALAALGHRREAAAAEVLALVDVMVDDRALRKMARRELHRLRSMGVQAPETAVAPPVSASPVVVPERRIEAWATDIDPTGSRALWLLSERRLGGVWFAALLLNDQRGLQELNVVDTTRKRFQKDFEESRRGVGTWVSLPGEYALRLVREGLDLARAAGNVPQRYQALREAFGEADGPPERALVYETISPVEANFNPDWLEESPRLLPEPEVGGWYIPAPPELRSRALDVARGPLAGLVVPGRTPEQQMHQLLSETAQQVVTPAVRRALLRRLEETAYLLVATSRLAAGRRAVAAATTLQDTHVAADRHPLVRMLLGAGLARLLGMEQLGSRRAAEVFLELVERSAQPTQSSGPVETRPSGLILPR